MIRTATFLLILASSIPAQNLEQFVAGAARRFMPKAHRYQFALIGDQQYNAAQEAKFPRVIDSMNREKLRFVVHDGDIKSGASRCDEAMYQNRLAGFQRSVHPFILTPGDNDWTDCGRAAAGGFDPLDRLKRVRELFFPKPDQSLGKRPLGLLPQSSVPGFESYVENAMWAQGEVLFATLHIVGTNNNFAKPAEFQPRNAANLFWLRAAFAIARQKRFRAVMLVMQANPGFERRRAVGADGFSEMLAVLQQETMQFPGQVVFVHGDSHYFRIDKPLLPPGRDGARLENFTRVETFGPPDVHWLRVTVEPRNPMVFVFEQRIVPENVLPRN